MNFYENTCFRCCQTVYQVDKIGPLKDFTFFHQQCFKCAVCGTKLTLRTYYNNQQMHQDDKEVYCSSHVPKSGPGHLDGQSVGIRAALNVPRTANLVNEQIRGSGGRGTFDAEALGIRQYIKTPRNHQHDHSQQHYNNNNANNNHNNHMEGSGIGNGGASDTIYQQDGHHHDRMTNSRGVNGDRPYVGKFDASALHIRHALQATELQRSYQARERNIDDYLDRDTQAKLEMRHRKEEDDLYRTFAKHREQEEKHIHLQIQEEWEKELEKLEKEMRSKIARLHRNSKVTSGASSSSSHLTHSGGSDPVDVDGQRALTVRHKRELDDLERNMTLKRDRRREVATRRRLEDERAATAALVERHSREMLSLINEKKSEFMRTNSYYDPDDDYQSELPELEPYPSQPPPPAPPMHAKLEIYNDPMVFADLDQVAINVAQEDQKTFTDLVRMLIGRCSSDVEKARTIFRWITVKNLNTMHFDENVRSDTPMGLLRGIKHGTESYHVLFKRLCSYVGLHCVVIKGYSKSAGYQPGVKFEDSRFRNSWNAVYVAGAWRFVQCNWGARHLVNAKDAPKKNGSNSSEPPSSSTKSPTIITSNNNKSDSLRYEYDDHYFLTDPKEFAYEFFPLQPEWQLLDTPVTLIEFQELPFVRSLFFRYGLYFAQDDVRSVMTTDSTGAVTVRIGMPANLASTLIFHYNLKFYDNDLDSHDGVGLKRFVMQSVNGNTVAFRVHAPCSGAPLLLDVFANAVTAREYLTGEPMKFKSVCKFKVVCADLQTVMVPLPDCASGEWGPTKALRLFGLVPLTHPDALAFAGRQLDIQFRMSRPLTDFMAALHKNSVEEKRLAKYVAHSVVDDVVTFHVTFPEEGQYGMDIYTRDIDQGRRQQHEHGQKQLLTHCCKYLINSSKRN